MVDPQDREFDFQTRTYDVGEDQIQVDPENDLEQTNNTQLTEENTVIPDIGSEGTGDEHSIYEGILFPSDEGEYGLGYYDYEDGELLDEYDVGEVPGTIPFDDGEIVHWRIVDGAAQAFDLSSRDTVWENHNVDRPQFGFTVVDGKALTARYTPDKLLALDRETGDVLWEEDSKENYNEPVYYDGAVYSVVSGGTIIKVDFDTGDIIWESDVGTGHHTSPDTTPAFSGGDLYVNSYWTDDDLSLVGIDTDTGEDFFVDQGTLVSSHPTAYDGDVIALNEHYELQRVSTVTGFPDWNITTDERIDRTSNIPVAGGKAFVNEGEGVRAVDAGSGDTEWQNHSENFTSGMKYGGPIVWDDLVITHGESGAEAYDIDTGDLVWEARQYSSSEDILSWGWPSFDEGWSRLSRAGMYNQNETALTPSDFNP